ncbi:Isochorismatase-like protein [Boletus coccyginus]|nr:Isochorismatase-like protein [Boletus coccyginus]
MAETPSPVNALLVIDMQVDFITGSLAVPDGPSVVDPVKDTIDLPFHARYASKDWHPPGHISFASAHPGKTLFGLTTIFPPKHLLIAKGKDVGSIAEQGLEQVLWPDHCIQGTPGAQLVDPLREDQFDAIILKGTDPGVECYSAFKDPWELLISNLEALLREKGVTDLYIVGVAGDHCVKASAIDAAKVGAWKTWVVREGVRSVSEGGKEWEIFKSAGVGIIDTISDLKARLGV